jgi:ABC-2 type transport system permease protein
MLLFVLREEITHNLKSPLIYIFALLFFLISYFHFSNSGVGWNGIIHMGPIYRNSPYLITNMLLSLCAIGVFAVFIPCGNSITKDFKYKTYPFLFTTKLKKNEYIGGRFTGSFISVLLIFVAGLLGVYIGSLFTQNHLLGEYRITSYFLPMIFYVVPNVFILSAFFFSLGTLKKSSILLYTMAIVLIIYLFLLQGFTSDMIRNNEINDKIILYVLTFLDPLGSNIFKMDTMNWSLAEKNNNMIPITAFAIFHRVFWIFTAILLLRFTYLRFKMQEPLDQDISDD